MRILFKLLISLFLFSFGLISLLAFESDCIWVHLLSFGVPRPIVPEDTVLFRTVTFPSRDELWNALRVTDLEKLLFETAAQNLDLLPGLLVDPALDHGPNSSEQHWSVDNEHAE